MKKIKINSFTKGLILKDNKHIKSFISDFKGGQGDEEDFYKLIRKINSNKLGIPSLIQEQIDSFISEHLEPMVFDPHTTFEESQSVGKVIDGVQHLDTDEEMIQMLDGFYRVLIATEEAWDDFAMEKLHPYLIN